MCATRERTRRCWCRRLQSVALQKRRPVPHGSLPPCGGGTGKGVAANPKFAEAHRLAATLRLAATPLPTPPPQGGREQAVLAAMTCPTLEAAKDRSLKLCSKSSPPPSS